MNHIHDWDDPEVITIKADDLEKKYISRQRYDELFTELEQARKALQFYASLKTIWPVTITYTATSNTSKTEAKSISAVAEWDGGGIARAALAGDNDQSK